MRAALLAAGASLFVMSGLHPALAGPCTDQISELQKRLASSDAGSGPTMRTGSTDATNVTGSVQSPNTTGASSQTGAASQGAADPKVSATPPQVARAGEAPDTQATAAMNQVTQNRATSPADVRAQIQGQPTATQSATGNVPQPDHAKLAEAALERARVADQRGDANACNSALTEARSLVGPR